MGLACAVIELAAGTASPASYDVTLWCDVEHVATCGHMTHHPPASTFGILISRAQKGEKPSIFKHFLEGPNLMIFDDFWTILG